LVTDLACDLDLYLTKHLIDVRIKKQTEDSIKRRTPAVRELAKRYNTLCQQLEKHAGRQRHPRLTMPTPVDLDTLFDTEANQHMWTETGIEPNGASPPGYVVNDNIKAGIAAMHAKDRAAEEIGRLGTELFSMVEWLRDRLEKIERALSLCTGEHGILFSTGAARIDHSLRSF